MHRVRPVFENLVWHYRYIYRGIFHIFAASCMLQGGLGAIRLRAVLCLGEDGGCQGKVVLFLWQTESSGCGLERAINGGKIWIYG